MRYLIILLLLTSCASRKVAIVKEETKTTIDYTAIVKTDSISTTNNNIKILYVDECYLNKHYFKWSRPTGQKDRGYVIFSFDHI